MNYNARIKLKRDVESNWLNKNPVLLEGEAVEVISSDGKVNFKIGDGVTAFKDLKYLIREITTGKTEGSIAVDDTDVPVFGYAALVARMEELILQLQENPGYSPTAEVVDIRAGYDGSTYPLAGDAVRAIGYELLAVKDELEDYVNAKAVDGLYYSENLLYLTSNGEIVSDPVAIVSGSGGSGSGTTYEVTLKNSLETRIITAIEGAPCTLSFEYKSVDEEGYGDGAGAGSVIIDNIRKGTFSVPQGSQYDLDIAQYLTPGEHTVKVRVENSEGLSKTLTYTVTLISLSMSTTMDAMASYSGDVIFQYTPVGAGEKTIHFVMDGEEIGTSTVSASGKGQSYAIPAQAHGAHVFEAYATLVYGDETVYSNTITLGMIWIDEASTVPVIMSTFSKTTATQGEALTIPYMVYDPLTESPSVTLAVIDEDGEVYSSTNITVGRASENWVVSDYPLGAVKFRISTGAVSLDKSVTVTASAVSVDPITDRLTFDFNPNGRSNLEDNPATWTDGSVSATFAGVGFSTADGWMTDEAGAYMLRLLPGGSMNIPFQIFAKDARGAGMTVEVEMATHNVRDYDSVVMQAISNGRGLRIASQYAQLISEQSELMKQFKEDDKVRVSFVVEPQNLHRLIYVYINGVMCGVYQYPTDDNFAQASPVGLTIGAETSGIDIYRIRVYDKGLTRHEVLANYAADRATLAERISIVQRNDIFDESDNIVINKLPANLPYMIIKCPELPQFKGDKKTCEIEYVNIADSARSFIATGVQIDVQGTSSAGYKKKNWKNKFKNGITYTASNTDADAYELRAGEIPSAVFCMKADVASSEGANNVELVRLYNDTVPHKTPAQLEDPRVRVGIDGLPCIIFWQNTDTNEVRFWGKYNFNYDKSSEEVYGLAPGWESWEIRNNTSNRVIFKTSDFDTIDPKTGKGEWLSDFEGRYPDGNEDYTNLKVMCDWLVSTDRDAVSTPEEKAARLQKFKDEFEDHFIKEPMLFYYVFTETFLMVDNRAKNFFPTTYDGVHWFPFPYDMDTAIGINNEGELVFDYDLEDTDKLGNADVFNGQSSTLWCNIRDAFPDEIMTIYQNARSATGSPFNYYDVVKRFADHQDVWPEAIWNEDAWEKYLEPLENDNDKSYLEMLQGDKDSQREWWLWGGFGYRDSKYQCGMSESEKITLRCYQPGDITVTPYSHIWPRIKYGSYTVTERGKRNAPVTLECPMDTMNDTEVYIYSADRLASIGDVSHLQVGFADFSSATKLQNLKVGDGATGYSNTRMTSLTVGNNELLTSLDAQNCVNLAMTVDLSGCVSIEDVKMKGTITTGVTLPVGGKLKNLELPDTVTNFTIRDQAQFETLDMVGYQNIGTLRVENTPNIPLRDMINTAGALLSDNTRKLNRVRLIKVEWTEASESALRETITILKACGGQDAAGMNTTNAIVTGRVNVPSISAELLAEINEAFPELIVVANGVPQYIVRYLDWDNTVLYRAVVAEGADAVDAVVAGYIEAPTREGGETAGYEFKDFGVLPTNIHSNVSVIAQYHTTYRVRFMNEGAVYDTQWIVVGEDAVAPTTNPTKPDETEYKYAFKEWSGSYVNVTAPVDIVAVYTTSYRVQFMNGTAVYATQWVAHGGNATTPSGTPTKAEDAQYVYTFSKWEGSLTNVTAPRTLTAVYSTTTKTYDVTFYNSNGTKLYVDEDVPYGGTGVYSGSTPVDPSGNGAEFEGWNPQPTNITGHLSVYAVYAAACEVAEIEDSWEQIFAAIDDGTYKTKYKVGNYKALDLGTEGVVNMQIAGFNKDNLADGSGTAPITWISKELLVTSKRMNPYLASTTDADGNTIYTEGTGSVGGWEKSEMRTYMQGTVKNLIPELVRNRIKTVSKTQPTWTSTSTSTVTQTTSDDTWIPSYDEMFNSNRPYKALFPDSASRIKMKVNATSAAGWWLRSADAISRYRFYRVYAGGSYDDYHADLALSIALGFCT